MPFPLFLALKYLKPKRSVTSVITCVSVLGVLLGVSAVIIVRAVMTGFGDMWERKILDFKPHISIVPYASGRVIENEDAIVDRIEKIPGVVAATPEIDTRCLLEHDGRVSAPIVLGVDQQRFSKAYRLGVPRSGTYDLDGDSIVLGVDLARQLGVWTGDDVTVYSPKTLVDRDEIVRYFDGDEKTADAVIQKYEDAGYITKHSKYEFRCLLTTEEYCRLVE